MQKKILSLAIAGALGGVAASANAALSVVEDGVGHILVVPYFTTQNGASTLINIVNTDQTTGKAVKVRFRSALDSDDIFDFQVFLSPGDVWTGSVGAAASGKSVMATTDKSCTRPSNVNQEFVTARLTATSSLTVEQQTREGYVEIFNMGDIINDNLGDSAVTTTAQSTSLYYQTKHVSGVAPCDATVLAKIGTTAALLNDLTQPTGTLLANWTIINVPDAAAYTGGATAIKAAATDTTRRVYWDQNSTTVTTVIDGVAPAGPLGAGSAAGMTTGYTADGVLLSDSGSTNFGAANYDFPDMSTPYIEAETTASGQADILSMAITTSSLTNEYLTSATVGAATDWVISMPTRRYHVAGRGRTSDGVSSSTTGFYKPTDKAGPTGPFLSTNGGLVEYGTAGTNSCVKLASGALVNYDREENKPTAAPTEDVISPNTVDPAVSVSLCGEVTVVGLNGASSTTSGVLASTVAYKNVAFDSGYAEGWAVLSLATGSQAAAPWGGLPAIGQAFIKATHPQVSAGVSGVFGGNWKHRGVQTTCAALGNCTASVVQAPAERATAE